jgi:hypothetical protein
VGPAQPSIRGDSDDGTLAVIFHQRTDRHSAPLGREYNLPEGNRRLIFVMKMNDFYSRGSGEANAQQPGREGEQATSHFDARMSSAL